MTKGKNFKQRVRARMAETGENYMAARQALLDQDAHVRRAFAEGTVEERGVTELVNGDEPDQR